MGKDGAAPDSQNQPTAVGQKADLQNRRFCNLEAPLALPEKKPIKGIGCSVVIFGGSKVSRHCRPLEKDGGRQKTDLQNQKFCKLNGFLALFLKEIMRGRHN